MTVSEWSSRNILNLFYDVLLYDLFLSKSESVYAQRIGVQIRSPHHRQRKLTSRNQVLHKIHSQNSLEIELYVDISMIALPVNLKMLFL